MVGAGIDGSRAEKKYKAMYIKRDDESTFLLLMKSYKLQLV